MLFVFLPRLPSRDCSQRSCTFLLCWSGLRSRQCARWSAWGWRCSPAARTFVAWAALCSRSGWPLRFQMSYWTACSSKLTSQSRFRLKRQERWWERVWFTSVSQVPNNCRYQALHTFRLWPPPGLALTYTEDVKAETLRHGFADQLIRKTVEPNMASEFKVSFFFALANMERGQTENMLEMNDLHLCGILQSQHFIWHASRCQENDGKWG